jgi:hypothetical protein
MPHLREPITWREASGDTIRIGGVAITPQSRSLTVRSPHWGLVWNRPVAVVVEQEGQTERIPIADVTRIAQAALLAWGLVFSLCVFALFVLQRRTRDGRRTQPADR